MVPPTTPALTGAGDVATSFRVERTDSELVQSALEQMPSWLEVSDEESRDYILYRLLMISRFSTADVRSGVVEFLSGLDQTPFGNGPAGRAKVILLSRFLFQVPAFLPEGDVAVEPLRSSLAVGMRECVLARWPWDREPAGPSAGRYVYMIAPLQLDPDSRVSIVADMMMMTGQHIITEEVLISEFDYFAGRFGRADVRRDYSADERRYRYYRSCQSEMAESGSRR